MEEWQIDTLTALMQSGSLSDVMEVSQRAAKLIGFEHYSWIYTTPVCLSRSSTSTMTSSNDTVHLRIRKGYYDKAPVLQGCLKSPLPVMWNGWPDDVLFADVREMQEDYRALGRRGGWAQSVVGSFGIRSIQVAASDGVIDPSDMAHIDPYMRWLALVVHYHLYRHLEQRHRFQLSNREREVLCWTADGLTAAQVAERLSISASAVNFHLNNAMNALGAPNKTAAVVKAILFGLLFPKA